MRISGKKRARAEHKTNRPYQKQRPERASAQCGTDSLPRELLLPQIQYPQNRRNGVQYGKKTETHTKAVQNREKACPVQNPERNPEKRETFFKPGKAHKEQTRKKQIEKD